VAKMNAEVKALLNKTLGGYSDDYRGNVRRVIAGTLDECVRKGVIPRHTLSGIELAPRIVTAEQYEQQNKGMVSVPDDIVAALAGGLTVKTDTKRGQWTRVMPPSARVPGSPHTPLLPPPEGQNQDQSQDQSAVQGSSRGRGSHSSAVRQQKPRQPRILPGGMTAFTDGSPAREAYARDYLTDSTRRLQSAGVSRRTGPCPCWVVSRTRIAPGTCPASMHAPPLPLL
jgi:hypothetical protein